MKSAIRNFLFILLFVAVIVFLFFADDLGNEDRDYRLSDQMHLLAKELKSYKAQHGAYPSRISTIRDAEELCTYQGYRKCSKVFYKPSGDRQDFRMAARAFGTFGLFRRHILYYHPQISMTVEENAALSQVDRNRRIHIYGKICFFCLAYTEKETYTKNMMWPIYKKTLPLFDQPQDWPEL